MVPDSPMSNGTMVDSKFQDRHDWMMTGMPETPKRKLSGFLFEGKRKSGSVHTKASKMLTHPRLEEISNISNASGA
ncbi:hypothetical protein [Rhizobium paknamense]|uniref:Uncharacterized protein n=1 Tax=Rhizobium paknamense TaxID=1206817 RepID=A0ABU0IIU5_9HYPH|nr:hypothetical protein [Rhizobium paknamense]MDQ0458096.1 hypothetical protein [Rhizobium paknamense]